MTIQDVADGIGISKGAISRWENGKDGINHKWFDPITKLLSCSIDDLFAENEPTHLSLIQAGPATTPTTASAQAAPSFQTHGTSRPPSNVPDTLVYSYRDPIPVFTPRAGHENSHYVDYSEPRPYIERPPPLIGIPNAFAVYAPSDAMAPKFERGNMLYVNPYGFTQAGDTVVLISGDGYFNVGILDEIRTQHILFHTLKDPKPRKQEAVKQPGLVVGMQIA